MRNQGKKYFKKDNKVARLISTRKKNHVRTVKFTIEFGYFVRQVILAAFSIHLSFWRHKCCALAASIVERRSYSVDTYICM